MKYNKQICVLGMGYIGLPTAALLASHGYKVHGVDTKKSIVDKINLGVVHFIEPDLDLLVSRVVQEKSLSVSLKPKKSDIFIIAVPTPFKQGFKDSINSSPIPDLDFVIKATKEIAPYIKKDNLIILESTSPVGTSSLVRETLEEAGVCVDEIYISYSPERVLPGDIIRELVENDRVVGGINSASTSKAADFYRTFINGRVFETNARTAEMVKLTENSFRDVNIAFANEISMLCDELNIDVKELIKLANNHPRVDILSPGCGVGGHCISVDPWFIVDKSKGKAKIIEQARRINDYKSDWVISKIKDAAMIFEKKFGRSPSIACMGLAFKADIDDLRQSPALYIASELNREFDLVAIEPNILKFKELKLVSLEEGLKRDICVYLVAHSEFKKINFKNEDLSFID